YPVPYSYRQVTTSGSAAQLPRWSMQEAGRESYLALFLLDVVFDAPRRLVALALCGDSAAAESLRGLPVRRGTKASTSFLKRNLFPLTSITVNLPRFISL